MVSTSVLKQISNLTDVDFNGAQLDLGVIGIDKIFITWYHDVNYGQDEYGCTTLPNIFHTWFVDKNTGQVTNARGVECSPYWGWSSLRSLYYDQASKKWYLLFGGARYQSASYGYPFVTVIDLSTLSVVKHIELSTASGASSIEVIANLINGKVLLSYAGSLYVTDFSSIMTASNLDTLPKTSIGPGEGAPLGASKIVRKSSGVLYIHDYSGAQLGSINIGYDPFVPTPIYHNNMPSIFGWSFTQSTAYVIHFDGSFITKTMSTYSGAPWQASIHALGVKLFYNIQSSGGLYTVIYDPLSDTITSTTAPCIFGLTKPDSAICTNGVQGIAATIYKFTPDSYFKVTQISGRTIKVTDPAGNPVANRTVYMWRPSAITNHYIGVDDNPPATAVTDANGNVTIPTTFPDNSLVAVVVK